MTARGGRVGDDSCESCSWSKSMAAPMELFEAVTACGR